MSKKSKKTQHAVLVGEDFSFFRDLERTKAAEILQALEGQFPCELVDFNFKLLPLSVGACLLIIGESGPNNRKGHKYRRADSIDCEVIESELLVLKTDELLSVAEDLVKRWRARKGDAAPA